MQKINDALKEKSVLIIFDEVEDITFGLSSQNHWDNGDDFLLFWKTIRALHQEGDSNFSFIITGVNPQIIEEDTVNDVDNPMFRYVNVTYLSLFNLVKTTEMVQTIGGLTGLIIEERVIEELLLDFGGHPFLIRQVCSKIDKEIPNNNKPFRVSSHFYEKLKIVDKFKNEIYYYFDLIVGVFRKRYPHEFFLIERLANDDYETFYKKVNKSNMSIQHLIGYGILRKIDGMYEFSIETLKLFLEQKSYVEKTNILIKEDNFSAKIQELIYKGETERVEFKTTLEIPVLSKKQKENLEKNQQEYEKALKTGNKEYIESIEDKISPKYTPERGKTLNLMVIKTLAAFANSKGGFLIIGVNEDIHGNPIIEGIGKDLNHFKSEDNIKGKLVNIIEHYINNSFHAFIETTTCIINLKKLMVIEVNPSPHPIYVKYKDTINFYIRRTQSTSKLDMAEMYEYSMNRFKN